MLYALEQGPHERAIIEQCIRERTPLPDRIANAPELGPGLDFFYMAFMDLTSCREVSEVVGPINWLAIQRFAEVYEVEGEQREDLFYHVNTLDQAYIKWSVARAKKTREQATPKHRPARAPRSKR